MREIIARFAAAVAGLTPEKTALIVAVGLAIGTFPVWGCATILCAAAAFALRLNPPALQLMNQIATPAQFALLLPFARVGEHMIGHHAGVGGAAAHAIAGWFCLSPPMGAAVYFTLLACLRARIKAPSAA